MSQYDELRQKMKESDDSEFTSFHWRMIFTAGTGFFADAYDLFIIGVVTALLIPIWHLTGIQIALLNGAALASAALGAVVFGVLSDKLGRKRMYGSEVAILFFGALLSAFSHNFTMLLIARIIVGFGIGGDYPSSAVVASECAGKSHRGFLVLLVFAMQAVGLIVGPLFASLLLAMHISPNHIWRILLGLGAIPAASVFYLRRSIKESPRYLLNKQAPIEVSKVVAELSGIKPQPEIQFNKQTLLSGKWLKCLIGTAGAWFCLDVAFYGCGVSNMMIMKAINPTKDLLNNTIISAILFLIFAVPGYFLAAKNVDKIGRKKLQNLGFLMMALCFSLIALIPSVTNILPLFILIYGLNYFFVNFGPNSTTFLIPSEIFPTAIRAKGHGISAAVAKIGAFIGAFFLPELLRSHGLPFTLGSLAAVSLLGLGFTTLLPEMKNISLSVTDERMETSKPNHVTHLITKEE